MQILIIDDHPLTCAGLQSLLTSALPHCTVHTCYTAAQARECLQNPAAPYDWVFSDIRLPDDPQRSLLTWLQSSVWLKKTILISAEVETRLLREVIAAGACGFIPKSAEPQLFLDGFQRIRAGETFIPAQYVNLLAGESSAPALTPRQQAVYALLLQGHANKVIARQLNLSEHTVKEYVSAILSAYGVNNRLELVLQKPTEPTIS